MELLVTAFMAIIAGTMGLVFVVVGALLVGAGLSTLLEAMAARHWPQVVAAVDSSTVEVVARREQRMFRPKLIYVFATATGNFTGSRISFAERLYPDEGAARRVADRYPAGTTVLARCNPDDPREAVLEIRWRDGLGILLFGLLCWLFPVGVATAAGIPLAVSAAILAGLLVIPALWALVWQRKLRAARRNGLYPPPGTGSDAQVAALMARGEKLLAIRLYRELHGGGLKAARLAVEALPAPAGDIRPDPL